MAPEGARAALGALGRRASGGVVVLAAEINTTTQLRTFALKLPSYVAERQFGAQVGFTILLKIKIET